MGGQGQKVVFLPLSRRFCITSWYDDDVTRIPSIRDGTIRDIIVYRDKKTLTIIVSWRFNL